MNHIDWLSQGAVAMLIALMMLAIAKKIFDMSTPYSVNLQVAQKDNPALGVLLIGYMLGTVAVICGTLARDTMQPPASLLWLRDDLPMTVLRTLAGLLLLLFSGWLNDRIVLRGIENTPEIVERRNVSVGVIMGSTFAGSGLIIGGILQQGGSVKHQLLLYALSQLSLLIYALCWQACTACDDRKEIGENQNLAIGIAYGGNMIAYALVLTRGGVVLTQHDDFVIGLLCFGGFALVGALLLPLIQILCDRLFVRRVRLIEEIVTYRNTNAGLLEAAIAIAIAAILIFNF